MKILVTGSHGFVGSHLVHALRERHDDPICMDTKLGLNINLLSPGGLQGMVTAADMIVHLASTCSTPGSVKNPMQTFDDTVMSAVKMLEAARVRRVPFLLTSSVKARDGMTPYGAAKRMVELWAREYEAAYGLPLIINRPGTIYGPGQEGSADSGWIAWFCRARDEGFPVIVNGDGRQVRDLLHVSDYVRLLILQIDNFARYRGPTWDVGGGEQNAVTVNQMVDHLGLNVTHGPSRYGDCDVYVAHNGVPGWEPRAQWRESETLRPR